MTWIQKRNMAKTAYQNINSAAHFVVDVVIGFCYCSVIKESGKELCDGVNKCQTNATEFLVVNLLSKQIPESGK